MPMSHHTNLLTLCDALQKAGIWLSLNGENALIAGPTQLVQRHPKLLEGLRQHKGAIVQLLEESLAHGLFGEQADDSRFERETCPECQQACLVVLAPRRIGVHRLPDGQTVCSGSDRAQYAAVEVIMQTFLDDRCLPRPSAVLSWYAIRGALEAWCLERTFFLPPRPFVLQWLDKHFTRHGDDERPMWQGLTLTLSEWGLEDEPSPTLPTVQATKVCQRPKLVAKR